MIHPSHSKKDLIELCNFFNIEILDIHDLSKCELVSKLENELELIDYIEPDNTNYFVEDINELKFFLESPNQQKSITTSEKERIIQISRDIILYCRNGYHFNLRINNIETLRDLDLQIAPHGDISTCRRALEHLKVDNKIRPPIEPVISKRVKRQMEVKEQLRKNDIGKLVVKRGKFIVKFD